MPPSGHLPSEDLIKNHPMYGEERKIPVVPAPTVENSVPVQPYIPPPSAGDGPKSTIAGGFVAGTNSIQITAFRKTGSMGGHF